MLRFPSCQFGTKNKVTLENEVKKRSYTVFYSSIFIFAQHSHKGSSEFNALESQHHASRFELQASSSARNVELLTSCVSVKNGYLDRVLFKDFGLFSVCILKCYPDKIYIFWMLQYLQEETLHQH